MLRIPMASKCNRMERTATAVHVYFWYISVTTGLTERYARIPAFSPDNTRMHAIWVHTNVKKPEMTAHIIPNDEDEIFNCL
jgi:hypothetical protein